MMLEEREKIFTVFPEDKEGVREEDKTEGVRVVISNLHLTLHLSSPCSCPGQAGGWEGGGLQEAVRRQLARGVLEIIGKKEDKT